MFNKPQWECSGRRNVWGDRRGERTFFLKFSFFSKISYKLAFFLRIDIFLYKTIQVGARSELMPIISMSSCLYLSWKCVSGAHFQFKYRQHFQFKYRHQPNDLGMWYLSDTTVFECYVIIFTSGNYMYKHMQLYTCTHTHAHHHARTHAHTHTHTHTYIHTKTYIYIYT